MAPQWGLSTFLGANRGDIFVGGVWLNKGGAGLRVLGVFFKKTYH